jgi:signal peptidase I
MTTTPLKKSKHEFIKTLVIALLCAGLIRSFLFEPFHIPSSSMKPTLLIGDYIFVSKYSYGYSRYSFPFGFNLFEGRFWQKNQPQRGDVVVFRLPINPSINYIKRIIGLPGDRIKVEDGVVYINDEKVKKSYVGIFSDQDSDIEIEIEKFSEILPEGKAITTLDQTESPQDDTGIYTVPAGYYFMMGDNRDNSQDSRFLDHVGYVPQENLVGRAEIIFFSSSKPIWKIWYWPNSLRFDRFLQKIE